jgi:hypothetical protein
MQLEEVRFILPNPDSIFQPLRKYRLNLENLVAGGEKVLVNARAGKGEEEEEDRQRFS